MTLKLERCECKDRSSYEREQHGFFTLDTYNDCNKHILDMFDSYSKDIVLHVNRKED